MKDLYAFTEFRLQMINDLDKLLHPLEGVLEQGDEVSQLVIVHHPRSDLVSVIFLHISNS